MIMVTLRFAFKSGVVGDPAIEEQALIATPGEEDNVGTSDDAAMPSADEIGRAHV